MGKSSGHKGENTFKFQTFSERIKNINIDVIHQIRHHDDTPEETGTYFAQALQKQTELNCTDHFTEFRKEVSGQVQTFTQLVHYEDEIVDALKKHLLVPGSMALPSLLDLLVQLARDLQMDFYKHFREFFQILVQLLNTYSHDVEILENTFSCLSYIFKFLWRYLLKDIEVVYSYFSALLGKEYKDYVRNFAAESFAFLMRKSKEPSAVFDFMFKSLEQDPDKSAGIGRLMFEMMKGVTGQFHSCTSKVFPLVLEKLGPNDSQSGDMLPWQHVESVLATTVVSMAFYAEKEHLVEIWEMLLTTVEDTYSRWTGYKKKAGKDLVSDMLGRLLRLLKVLIEFKHGKIISKQDSIAKTLTEILKGPSLPDDIGSEVLNVLAALLVNAHSQLAVDVTSRLLPTVFQTKYSPAMVYSLSRQLFELPLFEKDVLPALLKFCHSCISGGGREQEQGTLGFITDLLLHKCPLPTTGEDLENTDSYMLDFGPGATTKGFPAFLTSVLEDMDVQKSTKSQSQLWAALVCLPHVRPLANKPRVIEKLQHLMAQLLKHTPGTEDLTENRYFLGYQALVAMVMILRNDEVFQHVPLSLVTGCISARADDVHVLRLGDLYFTHAVNEAADNILTPDTMLTIFPALEKNLSSPYAVVRHLTLRILASFDLQLPPSELETESVFRICLSAETTPVSVQTYRERQRHLQRLEFTAVQNSLPSGPFSQVPLRYLLGTLFINFKLLWEPVRTLISSHAQNIDREVFWKIYGHHLQLASEKSEAQLSRSETSEMDDSVHSNMDMTSDKPDLDQTFENVFSEMKIDTRLRPDYSNFRVQLWQTMQLFPEKCSPKSRIFVPLLFRFLKNEYYLADLSVAPTQNIKRKDGHRIEEEMDTTDDIPNSDDAVSKTNKQKDSEATENTGPEVADTDTSDYSKSRRSVRIAKRKVGVIDTGASGGERRSERVRTRSQCSVQESDLEEEGSKSRTQIKNQSDDDEKEEIKHPVKKQRRSKVSSFSEESVTVTKTEISRVRTRSMCSVSETETDMEEEAKDVSKRQTRRSAKLESSSTDTGSSEKSLKKGNDGLQSNDESEFRSLDLSAISEEEEKETETDVVEKDKGLKQPGVRINKKKDKGGEVKKRRKAATSSLIVQLELFAKFKDPLCMYMEADLRKLYLDLLLHKNGDVQKTVFQCLLTYKYKYLMPYKENFSRLLDDKTFKNEIILFSIDHENSAVSEEHRADVLPLLMRILYGKMHAKMGKNTAGKQHSNVRQSIVFRFLNGCSQEELKVFIDLVFSPFQQLVSDNPLKMVKHIKEETDLTRVLPVKKMQGALNSIDVIFKKLGHHLDTFLPNIIQIIVGMATLCGVLLSNREKIAPHVLSSLKSIRQSTVYRIIQIFTEFDKYPWRPVEIDAVFEAVIWPQMDRLSDESLLHPTPLLKLLHCWTKNPRYFSLLAKHHKDDSRYSALPHVIKLLLHKDVSGHVTSSIMEMVDNLLEEREEEHRILPVEVNDMVKLLSAENVQENELGKELLLPHVGDLLVHIQKYVSTFSTQLLAKKHSITGKELNILSRLSSFVTDEGRSRTLVSLLIPFLNPRFTRPLKTEEDILTSILNLLKQIEDRSSFFSDISRLFATLAHRNSRILLAEIFLVVCEGEEHLENLADIVQQLNSWDKIRMEEPDYMLRLEGYRSAASLVKAMVTMETKTCLTLVHNCCFFITTVEDMSLRDNSTMCVMNIVRRFGELGFDERVYNALIMSGLMPELRTGLRSKKQAVLHEFVSILAVLVDTFGDQPSFEDLKLLRDKDLEADFFENVKHIQVYKRSRALRRLIKYLDTNVVKRETISSIFLPLISSFLIDDAYKKHPTVQDAAVDAVGVICRLLPWEQYLNQLKHYLKLLPQKLERQKILVRVIVAVLNNFHFDLSNSTLNVKTTPVPKIERDSEQNAHTSASVNKDGHDVSEDMETSAETVEMVPEINQDMEEERNPEELPKGKQLCSEKLATKIHEIILKTVIHQLHKILIQKARSEGEHKLVKSKFPEDEEILRVPIALAMVKLLQNLPKGALERYLPGILLKVCNFLKSRSPDIRNSARDTLVKIQATLGPRFFPFILSELRGSLRRGYQRHVLCYTVFMLLKNMEESVRPGDIDVCLKSLQEVFGDEIFGEVAEEKDVEGIKSKVFEARSSRSYDSYEFIAKYIRPESLMTMMGPLKQVLDSTHSHKIARKVQEVLRKVTSGLLDNSNITIETILVFIHSLTAETLPELKEEKSAQPSKEVEKPGQKRQSCLLLPKAAPRGGLKPKTSKKTNKHVLVEFGLQLLATCLKKQKVVATVPEHIQMLDPLVPMFSVCLDSKYVLINANCLRVLCYLLKFPLPSLVKHVKQIAGGMFVLLRKYATAGAARGDNMELVAMLFKAVTVLIRDVRPYKIEDSQLHVLLTFCEEDVHDHNRQSTAFSLLKAILSRKLNIPEIHELMKKIREMSISSESAHVQRECRQAVLQYLLDYTLGKKLKDHLEFYVSQLTFELESGRESTLEMLAAFFSTFPQRILAEYSGLFFLPMAASLSSDESVKCRKLIALAIKSLLGKLDHNSRSGLYGYVLNWFMDSKLSIRRLASQLCGLFVEVEGGQFESRLASTLPVIEQQLEPGKYKQVESESVEHDQDLMVYHVLNTLMKVLRECAQVTVDSKWEANMNVIWEHVDSYLSHPHLWVQLAASQLFGLLFAAWQPEKLLPDQSESGTQYLAVDTRKKLKAMAIDFVNQLQSELLNEDLANQVIKNMIFITKCAKVFDSHGDELHSSAGTDDGENVNKGRDFSVLWLVRKMVREAHHEAINHNKVTIKRTHVFKWLAAVSLELGVDMDPVVLRAMIPPLQRELNDQSNTQDPTLRSLAGEVVELLKKTVGLEKFTEVYASTQKVRAERRDMRKQKKAIQAVANPEIAAKRKLKKNLAKIEAKKRKVEHYKPSKKTRKRKYQDFTIAE